MIVFCVQDWGLIDQVVNACFVERTVPEASLALVPYVGPSPHEHSPVTTPSQLHSSVTTITQDIGNRNMYDAIAMLASMEEESWLRNAAIASLGEFDESKVRILLIVESIQCAREHNIHHIHRGNTTFTLSNADTPP